MSKYTHHFGLRVLNEADVCLPWCLAVYIFIALFHGLVLRRSCFKINVGSCPSSIYFLALMEALPCINAVCLSLVLPVYYFTTFTSFNTGTKTVVLVVLRDFLIYFEIAQWEN